MRFLRLQTVVFGPLEARTFSVDSDIILVHGPNEGGKSSVRAAIETILYGFRPADRDLHPLAQWDPGNPQTLHLESELRLDTGEFLGVERVLQSSGGLRTASEGADFSGARRGNRALPWMEWLSRDVFAQLYSLELEQLVKFDERARADIDDLLLPRTSALPLRAPSEIRSELRKTCNGLCRADNRGSYYAKKLHENLKKARQRVDEERQRDRELRDARSERAELEAELQGLRADKHVLESERADASFLGDLFGWNQHRRALGPAIDLSELKGRRLLQPSELEAEIEAHEAQLREPQARLAQAEVSLGDADARVLTFSTEINLAADTLARWEADRERPPSSDETPERPAIARAVNCARRSAASPVIRNSKPQLRCPSKHSRAQPTIGRKRAIAYSTAPRPSVIPPRSGSGSWGAWASQSPRQVSSGSSTRS